MKHVIMIYDTQLRIPSANRPELPGLFKSDNFPVTRKEVTDFIKYTLLRSGRDSGFSINIKS